MEYIATAVATKSVKHELNQFALKNLSNPTRACHNAVLGYEHYTKSAVKIIRNSKQPPAIPATKPLQKITKITTLKQKNQTMQITKFTLKQVKLIDLV